jgi:hypothetical protein
MQEKKAQIIRSKDYKQKLNIIYELNLKISLKQMFLRKTVTEIDPSGRKAKQTA